MSQFGKVAVMFGGDSAEREVSLNSGQAVLSALLRKGVDAHKFDPKEQPLYDLVEEKFDRVFIVLHGRGGEDGSLQGALSLLGLPYTGSKGQGSALAMDKVRSKYMFLGAGIPTAPFVVVKKDQPIDLATILNQLGDKVMVKPANEGSSIGMSMATDIQSLQEALDKAFSFDKDVLIEQWITGTEVTVSVVNGNSLPVIEMRTPNDFYDYQAKYQSNSTEYLCPAPISAELTAQLQQVAVETFELLGCQSWGRVDFIVDEQQRINVLEVNTVPGMTETSLVPKAAKAQGIDFDDLVVGILRDTL